MAAHRGRRTAPDLRWRTAFCLWHFWGNESDDGVAQAARDCATGERVVLAGWHQVFTSRVDERLVADLPLVQHVPDDGSARPIVHHMRFALSSDKHLPVETHCMIDLQSGAIQMCPAGPHVTGMTTCLEKEEAWWSADGTRVFFLDRDRYWQRLTLWEFSALTGEAREVFSETAATFFDNNVSVAGLPNVLVLDGSREFIWHSQYSGWGHLYLHDLATGARKRAITAGDWLVRDLLHVDTVARNVEFLASGIDAAANPYHRVLCRISLDDGDLTVLTPGDGDHALAMRLKRVPRDHIRPAMDVGWYRAPSGAVFRSYPFRPDQGTGFRPASRRWIAGGDFGGGGRDHARLAFCHAVPYRGGG